MKLLCTTNRIRSMIADCKTEIDIVCTLRQHKIRYSFATDTGYTSIRIPCKKGCIRIYRTCSRSAPFLVRNDNPAMIYPVPVLHNDY